MLIVEPPFITKNKLYFVYSLFKIFMSIIIIGNYFAGKSLNLYFTEGSRGGSKKFRFSEKVVVHNFIVNSTYFPQSSSKGGKINLKKKQWILICLIYFSLSSLTMNKEHTGLTCHLQGDQLNMAVSFWHIIKSDLHSVRV